MLYIDFTEFLSNYNAFNFWRQWLTDEMGTPTAAKRFYETGKDNFGFLINLYEVFEGG